VRYEDLVRDPVATMTRVYGHLSLPPSTRFMEPFHRLDHRRFLWGTAVDWESGGHRDFDSSRAELSDEELSLEQHDWIASDPQIALFTERFGYDR
jgi:hypothetical protein